MSNRTSLSKLLNLQDVNQESKKSTQTFSEGAFEVAGQLQKSANCETHIWSKLSRRKKLSLRMLIIIQDDSSANWSTNQSTWLFYYMVRSKTAFKCSISQNRAECRAIDQLNLNVDLTNCNGNWCKKMQSTVNMCIVSITVCTKHHGTWNITDAVPLQCGLYFHRIIDRCASVTKTFNKSAKFAEAAGKKVSESLGNEWIIHRSRTVYSPVTFLHSWLLQIWSNIP